MVVVVVAVDLTFIIHRFYLLIVFISDQSYKRGLALNSIFVLMCR